jgi:hypothetical protein
MSQDHFDDPKLRWEQRFVILKGSDLCVFETPPVSHLFTQITYNFFLAQFGGVGQVRLPVQDLYKFNLMNKNY